MTRPQNQLLQRYLLSNESYKKVKSDSERRVKDSYADKLRHKIKGILSLH